VVRVNYVCIKPILIGVERIRVGDVVGEDVFKVPTKKQNGKPVPCGADYFEPADKKKVTVDEPMTISDIARARQYKPAAFKKKEG
jgi:hypothetical protein